MNAPSRERAPDQGPICFDEAQRPGDRNIPIQVSHVIDLFEHSIDQFRAITPANEELLDPGGRMPSIVNSGRPL